MNKIQVIIWSLLIKLTILMRKKVFEGPRNALFYNFRFNFQHSDDPWVTKDDPWVTQEDPWVTQDDPWVTQVDPWVTQVDPWVTQDDPWV